ncbi:MAG: hypothetical protein ACT4OS_02975 [Acidimicrobiales bacterium]
MTRRLVEIDDDKLAAVRDLLGTSTLRSTVDEAFDQVIAFHNRRSALLQASGVDPSAARSSPVGRPPMRPVPVVPAPAVATD